MDYAENLLAWFDINKREMPWRNTTDPYAIWVSEIMLQQTQVDTVIPYYKKFMNKFPTVHDLAAASLEEVHTYWQGLGYYRRAENLHKGAKMVDEEYKGIFPMDIALVKKIPGIGPYTLGAILSIAFHIPIPAVDGNVMRILARQFLIEEDISIAKNRKIFEEKVMELMPDNPNRFNQALMELGALVCTPKEPKCKDCPVREICKSNIKGVTAGYPVKSQKPKVKKIEYKVIIIKKDNLYWMEKRPQEGLLANLWGFPMLEDDVFNMKIEGMIQYQKLRKVSHVFTHRKWEMEPVVIKILEEQSLRNIFEKEIQQGQWHTLKEMKGIPIATAFRKIIEQLK